MKESDVAERLVALETKFNGGPGQSAICNIHKESLQEFKVELKSLRATVEKIQGQLRFWAGGLALLFVISSVLSPFLKDILIAVVHKP